MTDLVACVSENEKAWGHISRLIEEGDWNNIFLIGSAIAKSRFDASKKADFVIIDNKKPVFELIKDMQHALNGKLSDLEVALNLVCGSGKEHMAILSALLKLGVGVRLVAVTKEGVTEL